MSESTKPSRSFDELITSLQESKKAIDDISALNEAVKGDINQALDRAVASIKNGQEITGVAEAIRTEIIGPLKLEVDKGSKMTRLSLWVGIFSLIVGIVSIALSLYTIDFTKEVKSVVKEDRKFRTESESYLQNPTPFGAKIFKQGIYYGVKNDRDSILVPATYDSTLTLCSNTHARFHENGLFGIIALSGEVVIPAKYRMISCFDINLGVAWAVKGGLVGMIDVSDNVVIPFKYDELSLLKGAFVRAKKQGKYGVIDFVENIVVPYEYDYIPAISENYFVAMSYNNMKQALFEISTKRIVSDYIWDEILFICDDYLHNCAPRGLVCVRQGVKYGALSLTGELVIPCIYDEPFWFTVADGLTKVNKDGNYLIIDEKGKCVENCM